MNVCVLGSKSFIGKNLLTINPNWRGVSREEVDFNIQKDVDAFFEQNRFDVVIHCAAVGGCHLKKDSGEVMYMNIMMFENVVRNRDKFGKMVYFSSGASKRGNPPTDPYGLSKWLIDKRIETLPNVYSLCIWACYGPHEFPKRFSYICREKGHIVIPQDKYFDFIDVEDVKKKVLEYCESGGPKFWNLTYPEKKKLSEWATFFGATYTIEKEGLGESYISL